MQFHSELHEHVTNGSSRSVCARTQRPDTSPTTAARIAEHIDQFNEVIDEIRAAAFDPDAGGGDSATGWRGASSSRTVDFAPTAPVAV